MFVRVLGLFQVWVCSYFFDLVSYFCGVSKGSGAHFQTFGFAQILGFFVLYMQCEILTCIIYVMFNFFVLFFDMLF